jgi:hypothetical protein
MSVVRKQLARLIGAYPAATIDEEMIAAWTKRMGKCSPAVLTRTVDSLIDNCKFFPSVAEFVAFSGSETSRMKVARQADVRRDCTNCDGGWILIDTPTEGVYADGTLKVHTTAKPCRTCLPDTYENWRSGRYESRRSDSHL